MEYQLINLRLLVPHRPSVSAPNIAATLAEDAAELIQKTFGDGLQGLLDGISYTVYVVSGPVVEPGSGAPIPSHHDHFAAEIAAAGYELTATRDRPRNVPIERSVSAFVAEMEALGDELARTESRTYGANERLDKIEGDIAYLRGAVEGVSVGLEEDIRRSGNEWVNLTRGLEQLTARISNEESSRYSAFVANADSIAALEKKVDALRDEQEQTLNATAALERTVAKHAGKLKRQAKDLREAFAHTHPAEATRAPGYETPSGQEWVCNQCDRAFPWRGTPDPRIAAHLALHQPATGGGGDRASD